MPKAGREFRSLYGRRWGKARLNYLTMHPFCVYCEQAGKTVSGSHVDHKIPHRGDPQLFWDVDNWQTLCATHHNSTKQRMEKSGGPIGCDANGDPLEPLAHWP